MAYKIYENITSLSIPRYFVKMSHNSEFAYGIQVCIFNGEKRVRNESYYLSDIRKADKGEHQFIRYTGKMIDLDKIVIDAVLSKCGKIGIET